MNIGMLWQSNKKELIDNVRSAAKYYETKYGDKPNVAFVNPLSIPEGGMDNVDQITVKADDKLAPGYVWMGVENG